MKNTPTLKFFRSGNQIVIGVHGTKDARDVSSWVLFPTNSVKDGALFHADAVILKDFKRLTYISTTPPPRDQRYLPLLDGFTLIRAGTEHLHD